MNALFLKDLKLKIRRGMRGRIENGKSGGGIGYGYAVLKQFDANGEPIRGDRTIKEDEAAIIRRIFDEYGTGMSPRELAKRLRSEEHTSELQSLMRISYAVFCLNKKQQKYTY